MPQSSSGHLTFYTHVDHDGVGANESITWTMMAFVLHFRGIKVKLNCSVQMALGQKSQSHMQLFDGLRVCVRGSQRVSTDIKMDIDGYEQISMKMDGHRDGHQHVWMNINVYQDGYQQESRTISLPD